MKTKLLSLLLLLLCSVGAWAIEPVGGKYFIRTAQDLKEYAEFSQGGNFDDPVYFEADIDCSEYGENGIKMIGNWNKKFYGKIYGQGHRISNLRIVDNEHDNVGFISTGMSGAEIRDLILDKTCYFEGKEKVGAFMGRIGWNDNRHIIFEGCGNEANVKATSGANAAAFVGCNTQGDGVIEMRYCWNTGNISGPSENAAFCAWLGSGNSVVEYCWNTGKVENISTAGNSSSLIRKDGVTANHCFDFNAENANNKNKYTLAEFDDSWIANGHLCYVLNEDQNEIHWYQNLTGEVDAYPVRFDTHKQVYAQGEQYCDGRDKGTVTYSNTDIGFNRDPHTDANGWCSVCGQFVKDHLTPVDGYYQIGTANDLKWFANYVTGVGANVKAKLTANIDYSDKTYKNEFIGYVDKPFKGEFDGQEHTIKIAISNRSGNNRTGLFAAINGATIKNLIVEGTATSDDQNCVGGLGGRSDGNSTIENVIVKTAVSYTGSNGDATCGGFFANMEGNAVLKNCAFLGSISTGNSNGNGGLVGWAGGGSNNKYTNCLVAPTAFDETKGDKIARNNPTKTNCHFVAADDVRLATGELCYLLNNKVNGGTDWYQNLTGESKDLMPVPFASHAKVYGNGKLHCDGTPYEGSEIVYGNTNEQQKDEHDVEGGFCNYCNIMTSYVANYMTPAADGAFEITNNKQMRWFAAMIKDYRNAHNITKNEDANAPVNARLMNDIDFEGVKDYMPIGGLWGQGNARYAGEFDGQFHKITNLKIDLDQDNVGIFGVIAEGAVIKNFTVDASCSIKGKGHVGIVGEAWRSHNGEFHLICLGNEANITGTGNNVGGILGVNMNNNGYAKCNMVQCYSTGHIKGAGENGQLTGWSGNGAYVENCYAIGEMTNCDGFARLGNDSEAKNCYSDKKLDWGPTKITDAMLSSGELCYKLGGKNFRQNLGDGGDNHPVLSNTKGIVNRIRKDVGYATQYITSTDVVIPAGVKAYAAEVKGSTLDMHEITEKIPQDVPVVLQATEELSEDSYYSFVPTTGATAYTGKNDLKGTDKDMKEDDMKAANEGMSKFYALTLNKNSEKGSAGFYWMNETGAAFAFTGVNAAGKCYLALPATSSGIRGFRFGEGEEATCIESLKQQTINGEIYNLQGQRVGANAKGIVIMNGKKVFVK